MLEDVFQYRTLIGKCELGVGLEWDDIEHVTTLESRFEPSQGDKHKHVSRKFRREAVRMTGVMRGDRIHDRVEIVELGLGGMVVRNAPYIARGEQIELVVDIGELSYRFRAQGVWLKDDGDDYKVGLAFVGMPVCLHKVAVSAHHHDVVDQIAAAA
ncbi:MAG: PilZ domain-containing protein [Nannocystis sp.]|nr:PilZ domain-containing protein [Nannocystis sp.]MBA3550114.1 PilZ domain-containing protein [Nannocystis sp.]